MGYICIRQQGPADCGPACLATICKHYGRSIPLTKVRELAHTDNMGTNAADIREAAEGLGMIAKTVKGSVKDLKSGITLPAIAQIQNDKMMLHFVVIHKMTDDKLILADPAKGIITCTFEEFDKCWTGILMLMVPSDSFEKKNETESAYSLFFRLIAKQKKLLMMIFVMSIIYSGLGILSSFYFEGLLDTIIPGSKISMLHLISLGVIFVYVIQSAINAFRYHLILNMGQRINYDVLYEFFSHVLRLPMKFFHNYKTGEIIARFSDAMKVRDALSTAAVSIMVDTLMAIIGGVILCIQNAKLFLIAVLIVALYGLIVYLFKEKIKKNNQRVMEDYSEMADHLIESVEGIETVKAFDAVPKVNRELEDRLKALQKSEFTDDKTNAVSSILSNLVSVIGTVVILWIGARFVIDGRLTAGELITYNALLAYFVNPVKNLINLLPMLQTATVAAERIMEIEGIPTEEENERSIRPDSLRGDIDIKDLDFRYGNRDLILKGINLHIKQGERIAIVGESGSGKTTLTKLFMGFSEAEKGEIVINGTNVNDIELSALRSKISYISQNTFLFSGTILDNLRFGNPSADMAEIERITEMTKCTGFINELPFTYSTLLGENGLELSGGQRQRLAIARALLAKPDLLIMDEATSNLDTITEQAIEDAIDEIASDITTIIIAHRLSTIKNCDRIVVLDHGRIAEIGNHEELLLRKGMYYHFWTEQSIEEE